MIYHEKYDGTVAAKSSGKTIAIINGDHPLWPKYLAAKASGILGEPISAPTPPAPLTEAEQAAQLCKILCDHVPGVSEAILGKLVEM